MRAHIMSAVLVAATMAAVPSVLVAQWPSYPSRNVPRTADGTPNLTAPAPRTADGKIDLSGLWQNTWTVQFYGGARPTPPSPGGPPVATFSDIGANMPGGLPLQPWAADLLKKRKEDNSKDNPDAYCLPMGLMQFHLHPQPRKIIQTPDLLLILYEGNGGIRQIFLDGRPLPTNDPQPWWYGYSVGRWDGDTLVVETSGFRDGGWLDIFGSPLTDAGKMTERFIRRDFGTLEVHVTIDDPKAYTKPFTVRADQRIMLDTDLIEFICNENEKSTPHMVGKE